MKLINYIVAATALFGSAFATKATDPLPDRYVSLGPVISGSVSQTSLPKDAQKYLDKHFRAIPVISVEQEFLNRNYDVKLADGLELEFDANGHIVEIEAPNGYALGEEVIKSILPHRAVDTLKSQNYIGGVETIERTRSGYNVDINDKADTELTFDKTGKLIAVFYD